jgi:hypothetical protein
MEATEGDSEAAAPSEALLDLRRVVDQLRAEIAGEASTQPTDGAALSNAVVSVSDLSRLHFGVRALARPLRHRAT